MDANPQSTEPPLPTIIEGPHRHLVLRGVKFSEEIPSDKEGTGGYEIWPGSNGVFVFAGDRVQLYRGDNGYCLFDIPRSHLQLNDHELSTYGNVVFDLSSASSKHLQFSDEVTLLDNPCLIDLQNYKTPHSYQPLTAEDNQKLLVGDDSHALARLHHFEQIRIAKLTLDPTAEELEFAEQVQDSHWEDMTEIARREGYTLDPNRRNDFSGSLLDPLFLFFWHAPTPQSPQWQNHIYSGVEFATIRILVDNSLTDTLGMNLIGFTNPMPSQQGLKDPPYSRPFPPDQTMPADLPALLYFGPKGRLEFLARVYLHRMFKVDGSTVKVSHSHGTIFGREAEAGFRQMLNLVAGQVDELGWGRLLVETEYCDVPHPGYQNSKGRIGPGSECKETIWVYLNDRDHPILSAELALHPGAPANTLIPRSRRMFGKARIADGSLTFVKYLATAPPPSLEPRPTSNLPDSPSSKLPTSPSDTSLSPFPAHLPTDSSLAPPPITALTRLAAPRKVLANPPRPASAGASGTRTHARQLQ